MVQRSKSLLFWIALCFLAGWPLRDGFLNGDIPGAGPDVISTLWGMWWLQQHGPSGLGGAESLVLNFPYGAYGVVLSPISAILWALTEPVLGIGRALALVSWIQVVAICFGCYLLALQANVRSEFAFAAAVVPLVGSYLFFGIGEGSVVAISNAPLPFGVAALIAASRFDGRWFHVLGAAVCMVLCGMENPYLALVLPVVAGGLWLFRGEQGGRTRIFIGTACGCLGVIAVAMLFGKGANPDYPREVAGDLVPLFGRNWSVVDLPWARLGWSEIFWPVEPQWTTDAQTATTATGGRYLGISVVLLSILGAVDSIRARWWLGFGVCGVLFSLGSVNGGFAFPFLFLNALMDAVARPLTQPTRFLMIAVMGFSVCCAIGVQWASKKHPKAIWACLTVLVVDGFLFGGLALRPPTSRLPSLSCLDVVSGPVLVWPYDALDGEKSTSQRYQMVHQQPAAHTGIASWRLLEDKRIEQELRGIGIRQQTNRISSQRLYALGYRWLLVDQMATPILGESSDVAALGRFLGSRSIDCGDHVVYEIPRRDQVGGAK